MRSVLAMLLLALPAAAKVKVAASIPDLASIAAFVGGGHVEAFSIAKAGSNPHFVEVLPSYMIKVSRASVYLKVGLGLDGWAQEILDGSRNASILVVDCGAPGEGGLPSIQVREKPSGKVDASHGDVHPEGNPHYWLDPANGPVIAARVAAALAKADPAHAAAYAAGRERFGAECARRSGAWRDRMKPLSGSAIVTYHSSWSYFAAAFGLRVVGQVEPFPGIPPTARHLQGLVERIKAEKAGVLIQEPYFGDADAKFLQRQAGIRIHRFSPSCDGVGPEDWFRHFDAMTAALSGAGR